MPHAIGRTVAAAITVVVATSGCLANGPCPVDLNAPILAVGDSILAYHAQNCASIPDVMGETLALGVANASQSGARMLPNDSGRAEIPRQYTPNGWDWVVVEGGINDLNAGCGCGECDETLEALVSADGRTGAMVDLVDTALADAAQVALVSYYSIASTAEGGFGRCAPLIDEVRRRYRAISASRANVLFVDFGEAVSPTTTPDAYADDLAHPSPEGSALLGRYLAEQMDAFGR